MSLYFVLYFYCLRLSNKIEVMFIDYFILKVNVTEDLWWRWQSFNLRPWDYDTPALSQIY